MSSVLSGLGIAFPDPKHPDHRINRSGGVPLDKSEGTGQAKTSPGDGVASVVSARKFVDEDTGKHPDLNHPSGEVLQLLGLFAGHQPSLRLTTP